MFYYKCKAGLYDLDIDKYIERPCHRSTRSSTGDFLRPNLCRTRSYYRKESAAFLPHELNAKPL